MLKASCLATAQQLMRIHESVKKTMLGTQQSRGWIWAQRGWKHTNESYRHGSWKMCRRLPLLSPRDFLVHHSHSQIVCSLACTHGHSAGASWVCNAELVKPFSSSPIILLIYLIVFYIPPTVAYSAEGLSFIIQLPRPSAKSSYLQSI